MHTPVSISCKNKSVAFLVFAFLLANGVNLAQVVPPAKTNDDAIEDKIENAANTTDESIDLTELGELLQQLLENPVDLNKASDIELAQTGLFTQAQVKAIINHRQATGHFISVYELQSVDFFSAANFQEIEPYITVAPSQNITETVKNIFTSGHSHILLRAQRYLQTQEGFRQGTATNDTDAAYAGNAWKYYAQYQYRYKQKFSFNITAEKDAGEDFFTGSNKNGFDFYSAHLAISNFGIIRTAVIGDYDVQYGQGLTLYSGLAFGKNPDVAGVKKIARGIKPYASVNEISFKRGGAVSLGIKNFTFDMFYSNRKLDVNFGDVDSLLQEEYFTSFYESGLHRTVNEIAGKNLLREKMAGANVSYRSRNFSAGFTGVDIRYDAEFIKTQQLYNQFDFTGNHFYKTGFDYNWLYRNINFFGEISRDNNGAMAYVNGAVLSLGSFAALSIVNRNYDRNFNFLYSRGFAESSTTRNEKGTYAGLVLTPNRYWTLSGYYDVFEFPWLRFNTNAPSHGYEYLYQVKYKPSRNVELYFRGRSSLKQENTNAEVPLDYLVNRVQDNYRFNLSYKISNSVTIRSRVEAVRLNHEEKKDETGFLIYQDIVVKPLSFPLSGSLRYGIFDTDSYDSRIYAYENDVLNSYSIPSFYNRGFRYYVVLKYKVNKTIDVWVRYSQTVYSNKTTFGSGLDEINDNKRSEIKLQMRLQF